MSSRAEQLIVAVAPLIDGAWRYNIRASEYERYWTRYTLTDDTNTGRQIWFKDISKNGDSRLSVTGKLPSNFGRWESCHSITVSQSRSPIAIARDINRRFLAEYLEKWHNRQKGVDAFNAETETHFQRIELVRRITTDFRGQYGHRIESTTTNFNFAGGSVVLHRGNNWNADLKLDLSFEETIQVLHFVKQIKGAK